VVHKFPLPVPSLQLADLDPNAQVVHVATQDGVPTLWIERDPFERPGRPRKFVGYMTGQSVSPDAVYQGTAHNVDGAGIVVHVYEVQP